MTVFSDILTVGLVLVLLFGSIALYLYTRIQQAEQKISLLETILLELKMTAEIKSWTELPASEVLEQNNNNNTDNITAQYVPFSDMEIVSEENGNEELTQTNDLKKPSSPVSSISSKHDEMDMEIDNEVEQYKSAVAEAVKSDDVDNSAVQISSKVAVHYDSMTLKELQALAKTRGIMGVAHMKKGPIIEALKTSDRIQHIEPGSSSSFLDTSSTFLASESQ